MGVTSSHHRYLLFDTSCTFLSFINVTIISFLKRYENLKLVFTYKVEVIRRIYLSLKMKYYFVLISLPIILSNGYVITLKNLTHIHCVNDNPDSAVYVLPIERKTNSLKDVDLKTWENEWIRKNATNLPLGPLTDKRWEDLPFPDATRLKYTSALDSSFSFSVFSSTSWTARLLMSNDFSPMDYKGVGDVNKWSHYSIVLSKNSTYIYKNSNIEYWEREFKARYLTLESSEKILWRPHFYDFLWSNSTSEKPSVLEIGQKETTCLLLYTSLCPECFLEVRVNNGDSFRIIQNELKKNSVQFWQTHKIYIDPAKRVRVSVNKKAFNQNVDGYWAMDIKLCEGHTEFSNFDTITNTICYELNNNFKSSFNLDAIRHKPGILVIGDNIKNNIYCWDVLGKKFPKCEKHKICAESNQCYCSWGFEGENCTDRTQISTGWKASVPASVIILIFLIHTVKLL
nr:PREDICTED: uncharacterized protein LOC103313024 isoform X2 [Tribolium castaneum]|eukprot:XP_015839796.1 PREDICTED: uncharacterized protein LOC103313024 isoform X2 [Tribolium castaneum]